MNRLNRTSFAILALPLSINAVLSLLVGFNATFRINIGYIFWFPLVLSLLMFIGVGYLLVKRGHDFGFPTLATIGLLFGGIFTGPGFYLIILFYMFLKGNDKTNEYGEIPQINYSSFWNNPVVLTVISLTITITPWILYIVFKLIRID